MNNMIGITLASLFAFVGVGSLVSAQTAPQDGSYCVTVIGKAPKGEMSPVLSRTCSNDPDAPELKEASAVHVRLIDLYQHAHNQPIKYDSIYGDFGPCDSDGYRVRVTWLADKVSGFQTYHNCNVATGYDLPNLSGDRQTWSNSSSAMHVGFVGWYMNDRIESFWLRRR